jgi:hypothetical protein
VFLRDRTHAREAHAASKERELTRNQQVRTLENEVREGLAFGAGLCFLRFCDRFVEISPH